MGTASKAGPAPARKSCEVIQPPHSATGRPTPIRGVMMRTRPTAASVRREGGDDRVMNVARRDQRFMKRSLLPAKTKGFAFRLWSRGPARGMANRRNAGGIGFRFPLEGSRDRPPRRKSGPKGPSKPGVAGDSGARTRVREGPVSIGGDAEPARARTREGRRSFPASLRLHKQALSGQAYRLTRASSALFCSGHDNRLPASSGESHSEAVCSSLSVTASALSTFAANAVS